MLYQSPGLWVGGFLIALTGFAILATHSPKTKDIVPSKEQNCTPLGPHLACADLYSLKHWHLVPIQRIVLTIGPAT